MNNDKFRSAAYHFVNPSKEDIISYAKDVVSLNGIICWDLEDIIPGTDNATTASHLKTKNRNEVIEGIRKIISSLDLLETGIRLNSIESPELIKDLRSLRSINLNTTLLYIFLPKIKSAEDISGYVKLLEEYAVRNYELIPIIETKEALNNLQNIINNPQYSVSKTAFGHCDFNFSNSVFPFYHQNNEGYWKWIDAIHNKIKGEVLFLNSPFLFLKDSAGFILMLKRLEKIFKTYVSQITLTLSQLKNYHGYINGKNITQSINNEFPEMNRADYANWIISSYEENKTDNRSFSITKDRILISPQEYAAAEKYLKNIK